MQTSLSPYVEIQLPQADAYRALFEGTHVHLLRDGSAKVFSERHVQCVWFDPALRPDQLYTRTGERVEVLDPGRWNREAGPDFLDAILRITPEQRCIQGDVEIHIHPTDWEHHGHTNDSRYDRVVAHVTFFPGLGPPKGLPGGTIEIALEKALEKQPNFHLERIDTSAYPFSARIQSCACAILLKDPTTVDPASLFHAAGCYRLEQKVKGMRHAIRHGTINDVLYHKTMDMLGYKQHRESFRSLASLVPLASIKDCKPLEAYAILMGTAGLLPKNPRTAIPSENARFIRKVWDIWWRHKNTTSSTAPMQWQGPIGRPANNPARRLAAAATFFTQPAPWQTVMTALQSSSPLKALRESFTPRGDLQFWLHHNTWETKTLAKPHALMGPGRIAAWINNVLLPLAAADGTPIESLLPLYQPEPINAIIRQTAARLLGRDHNPALYCRSGIMQQGIIQIFQDYCSGGCHACALADALRQGAFSGSKQ